MKKRCFSLKVIVGILSLALILIPVTSSISLAQEAAGKAAAGAGGTTGLSTVAIVGIVAAAAAAAAAIASSTSGDETTTPSHAHH